MEVCIRDLLLGLLDEVAAVFEVGRQLGVRLVQDLDALVDEQQWEHVLHTVGHVQDVGHLGTER